jgi:integrase
VNAWLAVAGIDNGGVFRAIGRWGELSRRALDSQSINAIVKRRTAIAGLAPRELSAHGLRSGYLTEAANRGIPLAEAVNQSRCRSVRQADSHYNRATRCNERDAQMLWPGFGAVSRS